MLVKSIVLLSFLTNFLTDKVISYNLSCLENTPNSVGVTLGNDFVTMWNIFTWQSPIGKCECVDDLGNPNGFTRYFWTPITSNETTSLNYASNFSK